MMGSGPTHPAVARLAGQRVGGRRLAHQADAQDDHAVERLSDGLDAPAGAEYARNDFANELWWRRNRLRLEAEPLRDAMLATSGQLNLKAGGPSFYPPATKQALEGLSKKSDAWGQSPPDEQRRRSIYMMTKRSLLSAADDHVRLCRYDATVQPAEHLDRGAAGIGAIEQRLRTRAERRVGGAGDSRSGRATPGSRSNAPGGWRCRAVPANPNWMPR